MIDVEKDRETTLHLSGTCKSQASETAAEWTMRITFSEKNYPRSLQNICGNLMRFEGAGAGFDFRF